jgi:hypothetical protein
LQLLGLRLPRFRQHDGKDAVGLAQGSTMSAPAGAMPTVIRTITRIGIRFSSVLHPGAIAAGTTTAGTRNRRARFYERRYERTEVLEADKPPNPLPEKEPAEDRQPRLTPGGVGFGRRLRQKRESLATCQASPVSDLSFSLSSSRDFLGQKSGKRGKSQAIPKGRANKFAKKKRLTA